MRILVQCKNCKSKIIVYRCSLAHSPQYCSKSCSRNAEYKRRKIRKFLLSTSKSNTSSLCPHPEKKVYGSASEAWEVVRRVHSGDKRLYPYKCDCNRWHLGHTGHNHNFIVPENAENFVIKKGILTADIICEHCGNTFNRDITNPKFPAVYCGKKCSDLAKAVKKANRAKTVSLTD